MSRPTQVDPRGQRFAAALTSVVLAAVLLTPTPVAVVLLAVQAAIFAVGASGRLTSTPYAVLYAKVVRPRLAPPAELEDARPPQFAQGVGLAFALVGLLGLVLGATVVGLVAVGLALVAALLNAALGLCLGCEMYLLTRRLTTRALA